MKEMQLLMGERNPLGINCLGIENLLFLFENRCLITLEGGGTLMAYCSIWNAHGLLFEVARSWPIVRVLTI